MREKLPFKVGITALSILIVIVTYLLPTPEGLVFEGKMLLGILVALFLIHISCWVGSSFGRDHARVPSWRAQS